MDMEPPTIDLSRASLFDPEVQSDPYPLYRTLHENCPVFKFEDGTDIYIVSRFDDLRQVLRNPEVFSNDVVLNSSLSGESERLYHSMLKARGWAHVQTLQRTDPPQHRRYRRLIDKVFTAARVQDMAPRIDALAVQLVDAFVDKGEAEIVRDLSVPLPGTIIAQEIGLDPGQLWTFKTWADTLTTNLRGQSEERVRELAEIELEMQHYLATEFEARRQTPRDDLLSALVHAEDEEQERLSMHELQNVMHQLISGGYETATSAISTGVWIFVRHPEVVALLQNQRERLRQFIEETLRFESPVQGLMRRTTKDTEVGGVTIPAGSLVTTRYGAANRDPAKFECPHVFDMDRKNAGTHMAFGGGPHFCPGAALARQELTSAFNAVLDRIENIELSGPMPHPPRGPNPMLFPVKALPIKFTKRRAPSPGARQH
jgi:cytochrome P450